MEFFPPLIAEEGLLKFEIIGAEQAHWSTLNCGGHGGVLGVVAGARVQNLRLILGKRSVMEMPLMQGFPVE